MCVDIETSPCVAAIWRPGYNLTITPEQILEENKIIMISYKWMHEDKVYRLVWDKNKCDKKLLIAFSKAYEKADMVVAHNGARFDLPWINARIIYHKLPPLHQVPMEDTYMIIKRLGKFNSNKLDYLGKHLDVGRKLDHAGFQLWLDVTFGKGKVYNRAIDEMGRYCDQDVLVLEDFYRRILPYHNPKVNVLGTSPLGCMKCGTIMTRNGSYQLVSGATKHQMRCLNCKSTRTVSDSQYKKGSRK